MSIKISHADLPLVLSGFRHRSKCRLICRCDIATLHTGHTTARIHYSIKYMTTANICLRIIIHVEMDSNELPFPVSPISSVEGISVCGM